MPPLSGTILGLRYANGRNPNTKPFYSLETPNFKLWNLL